MPSRPPPRPGIRTFEITVFQDSETGHWVGLNDALPVATEGDTHEALVERVKLIGPEMAVENGLVGHQADVRLTFIPASSAISQAIP